MPQTSKQKRDGRRKRVFNLLKKYNPLDELIDLDKYIISDDIQMGIDSINEVYKSIVIFNGWAFMKNKYTEDYERFLIIKTKKGLKKYKIEDKAREDVSKSFDNIKYKLSGFYCIANRNLLKNEFKIGILFKSKKENVECYNELDNNFTLKNRTFQINIFDR